MKKLVLVVAMFMFVCGGSFLDLHKPQDKKGKKREAHRQIENSED